MCGAHARVGGAPGSVRLVQVAGSFYAVGDSAGELRINDLARHRRREICSTTGLSGYVGSFVLTDTGRVTRPLTTHRCARLREW